MNGRKIKSRLIRFIGKRPTACIEAARFADRIKASAAALIDKTRPVMSEEKLHTIGDLLS